MEQQSSCPADKLPKFDSDVDDPSRALVSWEEVERYSTNPKDVVGMRRSDDVLLAYHIQNFTCISNINFVLALLSMFYVGVSVALLTLNSLSDEIRDSYEAPFHLLEFYSGFTFSVVEAFAIIFAPNPFAVKHFPIVLRVFLMLSMTLTLSSAVLITYDLEVFEVPAHELEYANQFLQSVLNTVMVSFLIRRVRSTDSSSSKAVTIVAGLVQLLAMAFVVAEIVTYNFYGCSFGVACLSEDGEQIAHWLEFTFGILSGSLSFLFCMHNKSVADEIVAKRMLISRSGAAANLDGSQGPCRAADYA